MFDANGRDANGFACCEVCRYPYEGAKCRNPGCRSNMSIESLSMLDARLAIEAKAEAERKKIRDIRSRLYTMEKAGAMRGNSALRSGS